MMLLALILAAQTAQAPVRVGGNMPPPQKVKDVRPVYPADAQQSGVQGVVIIEATVDSAGKVSDAKVLRSIPMLDQAALDAVRQWEYTPTLLNGTPVPVIVTVTVNFTMQGGAASAPPGVSLFPPQNASTIRLTAFRSPDGVTTVWEIPKERAAALPRWSPASGPLPLSVEEAARIGETWVKQQTPDVQRIDLQSVSLSRVRRSSPDVDLWYYTVFFLNYTTPPRPGDQAIRVVVLMDTTVVEPHPETSGLSPSMPVPAPAPPQGDVPPGVYRPDAAKGVSYPRLVSHVNPAYTEEARRNRISGTVLVSCVVEPDGTVADVRVIRSLDPVFGLDDAAIKAAKQYRFEPGMRAGQPVPVVVTIEMTFSLK